MGRKVVIAGSRDFTDYDFLKRVLDSRIFDTDVIISGGARGVDTLAELYAKERGLKCIVFRADWKKYGKSAGPIRNRQMAMEGTHLIAFWDGESRGTKNMIEQAKNFNLDVEVILINKVT